MRGGETDIARLLDLARREIAEAVMPQLTGDARYRGRLVLNALKLAGAAIEDEEKLEALSLEQLQATIAASEPLGIEVLEAQLQASIRAGDLDASEALYQALVIIAEAQEVLIR